MAIARLALVLLLGGLLTACGFHLRGAVVVPPWLQTLHLSVDPTISLELEQDLRRALVAGEIAVTDSTEGAAILQLQREQFRRQLMTVSAGGHIKEYSMYYEVLVSVQDAEGRPRLAAEPVSVFRELVHDESRVHAVAAEEETIRNEMRRALVIQVIRVLQAERLRREVP